MRAVLDVIMLALNLYWWIIIISAILSWLVAFNVINPRNEVVGTIGRVVYGLTEPVAAAHSSLPAGHGRHRHFADRPAAWHLLSCSRSSFATSTRTSSDALIA
jgi:hypothetical protein